MEQFIVNTDNQCPQCGQANTKVMYPSCGAPNSPTCPWHLPKTLGVIASATEGYKTPEEIQAENYNKSLNNQNI